jgi:hypothetical protein
VSQRSNDYFARNGRLQRIKCAPARAEDRARAGGTPDSLQGLSGAPPDSQAGPQVRAPTVGTQRPGDVAGAPDCPELSAFRPRGSLDRRVNCRRVPQPRWVGARWSAKGGNQWETGVKGKPAAFVLSRARVGCACSRGLQASAWEGARGLHAPSRPLRAANPFASALDLPFIGIRRGPRCTIGDAAGC